MSRSWKQGALLVLGAFVLGLLASCNSSSSSPSALTATISAPTSAPSIAAGGSVTFDGSASGGSGSYSYAWNFDSTSLGGGPAASAVRNPGAVTFNSADTYVVQLTVTDSAGNTANATRNVTVVGDSGVLATSTMAGTWLSTCKPDTGGTNGALTSRRESFSMTRADAYDITFVHQTYKWLDNDHCAGSVQVFQRETGGVVLYSITTPTTFGDATEGVITTTAQTTTVYDDSVVTQYKTDNNNAGAYGYTGWVRGTAMNTLGKDFNGSSKPTTQDQLFLVNGSVFFAHNGNGNSATTFPSQVQPTLVKSTNSAVTLSAISAAAPSNEWVSRCVLDNNSDFNSTAYVERVDFSGSSITITDTYYNQDQTTATNPAVYPASACDTTPSSSNPAVVQAVETKVINNLSFNTTRTLTDFGMATAGSGTPGTHQVTPETSYAVTALKAANNGAGAFGVSSTSNPTWTKGTAETVTGFNEDGSAESSPQTFVAILNGKHFRVGGENDPTRFPLDSSGYALGISTSYLAAKKISSSADLAGNWIGSCHPGGNNGLDQLVISALNGAVTHYSYVLIPPNCAADLSSTYTYTATVVTSNSVPATVSLPRGNATEIQLVDNSGTTGTYCAVVMELGNRLSMSSPTTATGSSGTACDPAADYSALGLADGLPQATYGLDVSPVVSTTVPVGSFKVVCYTDSSSGQDTQEFPQTFGEAGSLGYLLNVERFTYVTSNGSCGTSSGSSTTSTPPTETDLTTAINTFGTATTSLSGFQETPLDETVYTFTNNGNTVTSATKKDITKFLSQEYWLGDPSTAPAGGYPTTLMNWQAYRRIQ